MAAGCKNPRAVNYSAEANPDDHSCVYMLNNQDNCHWFEDVVPDTDRDHSFTLSYSMAGQGWVFFHDYFPDMYIHTREELFTAKSSEFYKHNADRAGEYHKVYTEEGVSRPIKPFFIDAIFQADQNLILETVNWLSEFIEGNTEQPYQTLSHITIWNGHQHTTRIALATLQPFKNQTARTTKGQWNFKDFRNLLIDKGVPFLQSIFADYLVVTDQVNAAQAWYKRELLTDKWFCVRFEFDNDSDAQLILHDLSIQAIKSDR